VLSSVGNDEFSSLSSGISARPLAISALPVATASCAAMSLMPSTERGFLRRCGSRYFSVFDEYDEYSVA
jgi:hypothetical protein